MRLIRGWESRYAHNETGGLQLSTARLFRESGEEDGLGDQREGEIRLAMPASIERTVGELGTPMDLSLQLGPDEPLIEVEKLEPGERREIRQELRAEDSGLNDSPFLCCLSREPTTLREWETLRAALPERYDTWTVTEDVGALQFEIECGIVRWLKLNGITRHSITRFMGWVEYSYETTPPAFDLDDLDITKLLERWLRKRRKYRGQQEYRLAWVLSSPQMETFPVKLEIELTRTGLGLFLPWNPPTG
jgi:hypothetical protein